MRALIIDEQGYWNNGERVVTSRELKEIEIPDDILSNLKTAFEIYRREKEERERCSK